MVTDTQPQEDRLWRVFEQVGTVLFLLGAVSLVLFVGSAVIATLTGSSLLTSMAVLTFFLTLVLGGGGLGLVVWVVHNENRPRV